LSLWFAGEENIMFLGSVQTRVDEKGRLKLPADVKRELEEGQKFFITSEDGRWAQLYPIKEWERKMSWVMKMKPSHPARLKFENATRLYGLETEMDGQGRVLLPQRLRTKARLMNEDVTIVGKLLKPKEPGYPGILEVINDADYVAEVEAAPITNEDRMAMSEFED
jgi:MraZ protein